jgi:hypothetical protein
MRGNILATENLQAKFYMGGKKWRQMQKYQEMF